MAQKPSELSDEELMVLYQQGTEAAFRTLYLRYEAKIYGYLRKRVNNSASVDELFQAAFLKLHRAKDQFNPSFLFAPWLFAVVRTTLLDWQKDKRNHGVLVDSLEPIAAPEPTVPLLARADMVSLPESQRNAIELRYFDEFSFEEIALQLKTSPSNARQLVSRGIKNLKSLFAKGESE